MKVVVLGASGNAGTALLRALEDEARVDEVVAVARRPPARWPSAKTAWRALDVVADPLDEVLASNPRATGRRRAPSTSTARAA